VSKGWNPAIEHTEPENAFDHYWYMWKLPMFGETDVDRILAEPKPATRPTPKNHVRLLGFDNYAQSQGASMVIFRGKYKRSDIQGPCPIRPGASMAEPMAKAPGVDKAGGMTNIARSGAFSGSSRDGCQWNLAGSMPSASTRVGRMGLVRHLRPARAPSTNS
jgi:ribulose bisphosphate carboxylase small subunit